MREILFKGQRVDTEEWVEGSLMINGEKHIPLEKIELGLSNYYIIPEINRDIITAVYNDQMRLMSVKGFQVIPETVGQYTGKEIGKEKLFEGDVVEWHGDYDDSWGDTKSFVERAVVVWDEKEFCWTFETNDKYRQPLNDWDWDSCFIIGNIHDNPELLGGAE